MDIRVAIAIAAARVPARGIQIADDFQTATSGNKEEYNYQTQWKSSNHDVEQILPVIVAQNTISQVAHKLC